MERFHPSKKIIGEVSWELKNKSVLLGVTGSAAAYKSIDIARGLMRRGGEVYVVMSKEASKLIGPELLHWATGNEVFVERFSGEVGHISLSEMCSSMVIAPATASTINKIAHGIADTAVTLAALSFIGAGKSLLIVPAMHIQLYNSPQLQRSLRLLEDMGVSILPPIREGDKAKFPLVEDVVGKTVSLTLRGEDLKNKRILVTAGPTREKLDEIRHLTNPSSGKMGLAIAREAWYRGGTVKLILGPTPIKPPKQIEHISVETTEEMFEVFVEEAKSFSPDIVVLAAAPLDYKFSKTFKGKIRSGSTIRVTLEPTPKIAEAARQVATNSVIIGFAAEILPKEELVRSAMAKMQRYDFNIIVANDVSRRDVGFASDYNEVIIIHRSGKILEVPKLTKNEIARIIIDEALKIAGK